MNIEIFLLCGLLFAALAFAAWRYEKHCQRRDRERHEANIEAMRKRQRLDIEKARLDAEEARLDAESRELDKRLAAVTAARHARERKTPPPVIERRVGMRPTHSAPYTPSPSPTPAPDYLAPTLLWHAATAPAPEPEPCRASSYSSGGGGDFGGGGATGSWDSGSSSSSSDSSSSSSDSGSSSSSSSD